MSQIVLFCETLNDFLIAEVGCLTALQLRNDNLLLPILHSKLFAFISRSSLLHSVWLVLKSHEKNIRKFQPRGPPGQSSPIKIVDMKGHGLIPFLNYLLY